METEAVQAVKVYFCYADEDEPLRARLEKHLSPLRKIRQITGWFDRDIHAGTDWAREIEVRIDEASIILLLISPDFIYTDYCYSTEMRRALGRHKAGEAYVIPIIMRPVQWEDTPIGELEVLSAGGKPITQWSNRDAAFLEVAQGIRELVRTLLRKQALSLQETTILYPEQFVSEQTQSVLDTQKYLISPGSSNNEIKSIPTSLSEKDTIASDPLIRVSYQMGRDFLLANNHQVAHVLVEISRTVSECPLNLALVVNHSQSMKGVKLKNAKEMTKMIIDRLEPSDYISVVIFDDTAQVIIPSMPANDPPGMKAAIDRIRDAGGTTISLGMIQGLGELRRWKIPNAVNRMILLTDGDGSTVRDMDRCYSLAKDAAAAGISIYSLGFGSGKQQALSIQQGSLLDTIGRLSGGKPAEFIQDLSDSRSTLQTIVDRQSGQVSDVDNVTLTFRLPTGVSPNQAINILPLFRELDLSSVSTRNGSSHKSIVIRLGNLQKGRLFLILFALAVDPRPRGLFRLAQAEISYDVPTMITGDGKMLIDINGHFS